MLSNVVFAFDQAGIWRVRAADPQPSRLSDYSGALPDLLYSRTLMLSNVVFVFNQAGIWRIQAAAAQRLSHERLQRRPS
jgi:hypothetical protein